MTNTAPRQRGHLPHMSMHSRVVPRLPVAEAPVTFASLGLTEAEGIELRARIDRERERERAEGRARWLAAGLKRMAAEAAEVRQRNERRRAALAAFPTLLAERRARLAAKAEPSAAEKREAEAERIRRDDELHRGRELLRSLRR